MQSLAATTARNTLGVLAFAGLLTSLLARGVLIMVLGAPRPGGSSADAAAAPVKPKTIKPLKLIPFPALAAEIPDTPVVDPASLVVAPTGEPFTPLNAEVVGIAFFDNPASSLTTLVVSGHERTVHSINPCVPDRLNQACSTVGKGYTLVAVERKRVRVRHDGSGKEQDLELYPNARKPATVAAAAEATAAPSAEGAKGKGSAISQLMDGVKRTGPNSWEAPPGMRDEVLGRLAEVAMEGRWLPYFEGGKISGFKLVQTAGSSAFEKIGLQAGDVIKGINGSEISSPDKILEVFTRFRDARDVSVDIVRGTDVKTPTKVNNKYVIN